jgi:hypothetical protein
MVPGGSGAQAQAQGQGHVSTQNAQVTNAEVDQIVNESRRAGTATPPIPPQSQQQYQQGQVGQAQQPYQARVKGQRQGV